MNSLLKLDEYELHTQLIKLHSIKYGLYTIGVIFTGGFLTILLRWSTTIQLKMLFARSNYEEASHILVIKTKDGQIVDQAIVLLNDEWGPFPERLYGKQFQYQLTNFYVYQNEIFILQNTQELSQKITDRDLREKWFGENLMKIPIKSIPQLMIDDILTPFNIFQFCALTVWALDEYLGFASIILILTILQISIQVRDIREQLFRIRDMVLYKCDVQTEIGIVDSSALVPGDVFYIQNNDKLTCDAILIEGDCSMNEAILTGESIPVHKNTQNKNILYAGTTCIHSSNPTKAKVYQIGFSTWKGQMAKQILFNQSDTFSFQRDSVKYILVLAFFGLIFAIFTFSVQYQLSLEKAIINALEIFTVIVPPTLPILLGIGVQAAVFRLEKQGIFCVKQDKVNVAALIDVVGFDKTGTLTTLELSVKEVITEDIQLMQIAMGTCRSKGDPVDDSILQFVQFEDIGLNQIRDKNQVVYKINKKYEFEPELMRMTVVVNNKWVFCKGAPEIICSKLELPILNRVIACAYKEIEYNEGLSREELEKDLTYLGLISFDNPLKPYVCEVIQELKNAEIISLMITGDMESTALSVAQQCGISKQYVFARKKPQQKSEIMAQFKKLNKFTAFVGDGSNDTYALKSADVGLAVSEEASLAAPFSCGSLKIGTLIKEGRACLVTSIECFKFLTIYSCIQSVAVLICFVFGADLTNNQYLSQDLLLICPIAWALSQSLPNEILHKSKPVHNLLSSQILASVFGHIFICTFETLLGYYILTQQDFYSTENLFERNINILNTTLIILANCEVIFVALALSKGKPFRQNIIHNKPYLLIMSICIGVKTLFIIYVDHPIFELLNVGIYLPQSFRQFILEYVLLFGIVSLFYEKYILYYIFQ